MEFEEAVLDVVASLLAGRSSELEEVGLTCRPEPLSRLGEGTSELALNFVDSSGIADVIEFHVVKDGQPIASLQEVEAWLREALDDVVSRRRSQR